MNLSELIQHVLKQEDLSYNDLVARASNAGYETSKAQFSKIVRREIKWLPQPDTIFMLAAALNVTEGVVVKAACETFGITIFPADVAGDAVIFSDRPRTPKEVEAQRKIVRANAKVPPTPRQRRAPRAPE